MTEKTADKRFHYDVHINEIAKIHLRQTIHYLPRNIT